jgi:hypothetical protein
MYRSPYLLCVGLLSSLISFGQNSRADTLFVAAAKKNSIALYEKSISGQSHLYNGSAYTEYISQGTENPYFIDEYLEGSVMYDEEFHDNVPLLYDISLDRIVIDNAFSIKKVMLVNEKVAAFTIKDHRFVHLVKAAVPEGHYEIMYDGKSKVYVRHRKTLQSKRVDYSVINVFEEKKVYYIYKDGRFYSVKSKGSVLKVLETKKKELKKFIRDSKLVFGENRAKDIGRVVERYDQLN